MRGAIDTGSLVNDMRRSPDMVACGVTCWLCCSRNYLRNRVMGHARSCDTHGSLLAPALGRDEDTEGKAGNRAKGLAITGVNVQ